ncbi:MAG: hypothetical protein AAF399_31020 [Bacteroidota bacterium]
MLTKEAMPVGIGCCHKDQYEDLLRISSDAETMNPTWEEWLAVKEHTKRKLAKEGLFCVDVVVDLFELIDYSQQKELQINGSSRAEFVQHLLSTGRQG